MAAREYYEAIGRVLGFVLSANDNIESQREREEGIHIKLIREDRYLDLIADPGNRYFNLYYSYRLSRQIAGAYESDTDLLKEALSEYDVNERDFTDRELAYELARERVKDIPERTVSRLVNEINKFVTGTDCKWTAVGLPDEVDHWDGIEVRRPIYPYETDFGPRDYERAAQDAISVGKDIQNKMSKEIEALQETISGDFE